MVINANDLHQVISIYNGRSDHATKLCIVE